MNTLISKANMLTDLGQLKTLGSANTLTAAGDSSGVTTTDGAGISIIQAGTPLTRLNYFDGKFLRASDLQGEQLLSRAIALSNQAGGAGVVYGLDVTLGSGDQLNLSAGLGIGPGGRGALICRRAPR